MVSVPHGWDHCDPNAMLWIAHAYGGVNVKILSDDLAYDVPSGSARFSGTPVEVEAVRNNGASFRIVETDDDRASAM